MTTTTNSCKGRASSLAMTSLLLLLLLAISSRSTMAQSPTPAPVQSSPVQVGSPEPSSTPSSEPTKSPVTPPPTRTTPDCFTSTTDLFEILELASPFVDKEYILCPNTVFDIGFHDDMGQCCTRGQLSVYVKSKTHIKCGESGSSSNNCTIRGGEFQLMIGQQVFEETITTEVKFTGLTWEASTNSGLVLASQGDVTFVDNIIKNFKNRGPVVSFYTPPFEDGGRRLRELFKSLPGTPRGRAEYYMKNPQAIEDWIRESVTSAEEAIESGMVLDYEGRATTTDVSSGIGDDRQRRLQPGYELTINFIDCQFYNNSQGKVLGLTQQGIVSALTAYCPHTFVNCTFTNNTYTGVENRIDGWLVKTGGSRLNVSNTCSYDNNLTGFGAFQQYGNASFEATNNFAWQNGYSNYFCQFIALSSDELPDNPGQIQCIDAERKSCNGITMTSPSTVESAATATWTVSLLPMMLIPAVVAQMAFFGM